LKIQSLFFSNWAVAISADIEDLENGRLFEPEISNLYPGSQWAACLKERFDSVGGVTLTSDTALREVQAGNLDPRRLLVVQHVLEKNSQKLIDCGAVPFMWLMFESPLYAGFCYEQLASIEARFEHIRVFMPSSAENATRRRARFPSFSRAYLQTTEPEDWAGRRFVSMVMANKYVSLQRWGDLESYADVPWWLAMQLRHAIRGNPATEKIDLRQLQLQDKRLEAIDYFGRNELLDLFGGGWHSLWKLPPKYRKRLTRIVDPHVGRVTDKIGTLRKYKFNLCFENVRYPGYVTEKIFDAMVAGTIPVYWGAPDITEMVPADAFINAADFSGFDPMHDFMRTLSVGEAERILKAGRDFLRSNEGQRFSYEGFAEELIQVIINWVSTLNSLESI
jgi:hypothetical protein